MEARRGVHMFGSVEHDGCVDQMGYTFHSWAEIFSQRTPVILYQTKCDRNQLSKPRITA